MPADAPTHPGPPPRREEGRTARVMWQGQWDTYQRWVADQAPQLAPLDELQEEDPRWRPSGWAWRRKGCRVLVPGSPAMPSPRWTNPHRLCEAACVAYIEVASNDGQRFTWMGACAQHIEGAMTLERGWRWAHDASMVAMASDDERESWLAMYALGFQP